MENLNITDEERIEIVRKALCFLGKDYNTPEAKRMLYAIAYQESNFFYTEQIGGPAKGYWQFEKGGGVKGVMSHRATKAMAEAACSTFNIGFTNEAVYQALPTNPVLAAIFARLLLWSDPKPLPIEKDEAWSYYIRNWRPGKPHIERWGQSWLKAYELGIKA